MSVREDDVNEDWTNQVDEVVVEGVDEESELQQVRQLARDDDSDDGDEIDLSFDAPPVRCAFTTGAAGTGKTYHWRERIRQDPSEGVLCATTGIAGVNLGTVTINANNSINITDVLSLKPLFLTTCTP